MLKTHFRILGVDCTYQGQTWYEHTHQTACGYVRNKVTFIPDKVTCKICIRKLKKIKDHS